MAKTEEEKAISRIENRTKKAMTSVGTYRVEFAPTLRAYAQLRWQYETLNEKFIQGGNEYVEEYTNKNGSTNMRKTPEYQVIENMRKDLLTYENTLGLTPIGLKKINQRGTAVAASNGFISSLKEIEL